MEPGDWRFYGAAALYVVAIVVMAWFIEPRNGAVYGHGYQDHNCASDH